MAASQPSPLKEIDDYAVSWGHYGEVTHVLSYRDVTLLDLLCVDVSLLLREFYYGKRSVSWKRRLATPLREFAVRFSPWLVNVVERMRFGPSFRFSSTYRPRTSGRSILFVVESGTDGIAGTLLPVIRRVIDDGKYEVIVFAAQPSAAKRLDVERIPFLTAYEYAGNWRYYGNVARTVIKSLRSGTLRPGGEREELLAQIVSPRIANIIGWRLIQTMHFIDVSYLVLSSKVLALVTASDTHPAGKVFTMVANRLGISSLVIQNGLYGATADALRVGFLPVSAKTVCVWGEKSRDILIQHAVPSEKIKIVGQPRFDQLSQPVSETQMQQLRSVLRLPEHRYLVVFASQNIFRRIQQHIGLLNAFKRVVSTVPAAMVMIKTHPAEDTGLWKKAEDLVGASGVRLVSQIDLYTLLRASDLVITVFSTVGLEALMCGRPLIVLRDQERSTEMQFVEHGAALDATLDSLPETVQKVLVDGSLRTRLCENGDRFVAGHIAHRDGMAAERLTGVIYRSADT